MGYIILPNYPKLEYLQLPKVFTLEVETITDAKYLIINKSKACPSSYFSMESKLHLYTYDVTVYFLQKWKTQHFYVFSFLLKYKSN